MSNLKKAIPPIPVSSPLPLRTWDFLETALVVLIADGVFNLTAQFAIAVALGVYVAMTGVSSEAKLIAMWSEGRWQGIGLVAATLPTIAVLWVAIRMAGREFAEYLALKWPTRTELLRAFGAVTIVVIAESLVAYLVGVQPQASISYRAVGGPAGLLILLIGGCIAAPVVEEFIVRGFMFRGWSQSFLGPRGAILLTSALWAMNHVQYDWFGRLEIFALGLVLCYFRWRSGSTWLTVIVHSTLNTFLFFMMGPYV